MPDEELFLKKSPFVELKDMASGVKERDPKAAQFADYTRALFDEIDTHTFSTAKGEQITSQLRDFQSGLEAHLELLQNYFGLSRTGVDRLMATIPREHRRAVADGTLLRIQHETNYFDKLKDENVVAGLLNRFEGGKYNNTILFLSPDNLILSLIKKVKKSEGLRAAYTDLGGVILASTDLPSDEELLKILAVQGTLPDIVASLDHEMTHGMASTITDKAKLISYVVASVAGVVGSTQIENVFGQLLALSTPLSASLLMYGINRNDLLKEVHAYQVENDVPYQPDAFGAQGRVALSHIVVDYGMGEHRMQEAIVAHNMIRALRLLGVSDEEVAHLIPHAKLNQQTKRYPVLEGRLQQEVSQLGLTLENRTQLNWLLCTLYAKQQIETISQRKLAKIVTTQELMRESGSLQWRYNDDVLKQFKKIE